MIWEKTKPTLESQTIYDQRSTAMLRVRRYNPPSKETP